MILPYMDPITHHLISYLRRNLNCDFGFIPGKKIGGQLCSHKQKEPMEDVGMYQIPCSCDAVYIGETSRPLKERIKKHIRDGKKKNTKSAISCHILEHSSHVIHEESATSTS
jgi:GIY-YIG catalytic domain